MRKQRSGSKGKRAPAKVHVNQEWFQKALESIELSQRRAALIIGIDPSSLCLALKGERRLKLDEAVKLSELLDLPLNEVLLNAGVTPPETKSKESVEITGFIDGFLGVHFKRSTGPRRAPLPLGGLGAKLEALQYKTLGSPIESADGAIVYFSRSSSKLGNNIGKLCIVKIANGDYVLRVPKKGYNSGRYSLLLPHGELKEQDALIESSWPVVLIKY